MYKCYAGFVTLLLKTGTVKPPFPCRWSGKTHVLNSQIKKYIAKLLMYIKTQGSVLCGPSSRRATPMSILTGRKKTQFLHLRSSVLPLRNKMIFAVDTPSNFSTPLSKFEQNRLTRSRDMRLQKLA